VFAYYCLQTMSVTQTVEANEFFDRGHCLRTGKGRYLLRVAYPIRWQVNWYIYGGFHKWGPPNRMPINYRISSLYHPFMVNVGLFYYKPSN